MSFHVNKLSLLLYKYDHAVAESNSMKEGEPNIKIILPVIFAGFVLIGLITSWLWHARKNNNHAILEEGINVLMFTNKLSLWKLI